jgi:hypothetical protein
MRARCGRLTSLPRCAVNGASLPAARKRQTQRERRSTAAHRCGTAVPHTGQADVVAMCSLTAAMPASKLPRETASLVELICNLQMMQQHMTEIG